MFPKTTDKVTCLEGLVGIKSTCMPGAKAPAFFVEDIEGWDTKKLASLAKGNDLKGADFGKRLINSAAREMMGDIELLINNGYSLQNTVGDMCSACELLPVYTMGAGVIVRSTTASKYQYLKITRVNILANVTGTRELVFDDGVSLTKYNVDLEAGVIMPVSVPYETVSPWVKIYFSDNTVPLGQINCPTTSSCGCGGSSTATSPVSIAGLLSGVEVPTQYGFIVCASVGCSYDTLVCNLVHTTPNIFGMTLMFKLGEKLNIVKSQSDRNNETASYGDGNEEELQRNYSQLYWAKLQGGKDRKGIRHIVHDYLKRSAGDKCIVCDTKVSVAYAGI